MIVLAVGIYLGQIAVNAPSDSPPPTFNATDSNSFDAIVQGERCCGSPRVQRPKGGENREEGKSQTLGAIWPDSEASESKPARNAQANTRMRAQTWPCRALS